METDADYVSNLRGCVVTVSVQEKVLEQVVESIELHTESMAEEREPVPEPQSAVGMLEEEAVTQ